MPRTKLQLLIEIEVEEPNSVALYPGMTGRELIQKIEKAADYFPAKRIECLASWQVSKGGWPNEVYVKFNDVEYIKPFINATHL